MSAIAVVESVAERAVEVGLLRCSTKNAERLRGFGILKACF